jgi:protein-tyrosine phosphatase
MRGLVDLHCHFVAGIDDGARSVEDGLEMLRELGKLGFELVIATPHMRPGLFDNEKPDLERAYANMLRSIEAVPGLPRVALSSEHYFDEVIYQRLLAGDALPYPGGRAALLEFYEIDFPPSIDQRFFDLRRNRVLPVIAHPERYQCLWRSTEPLERLIDSGAAALLDTAALVGKYGRRPKLCAEDLLERGLYHAACSDAHKPSDVEQVASGMRRIEDLYGREEVEFLFHDGPLALLSGTLPDEN